MLRLVSFTACKQSISVLRCLLQLALKGELRGLALCYWTVEGGSRVILTGAYRADAERALGAAELIKVKALSDRDLFG